MWCKHCEKESFSEVCEICGKTTEVDIPKMIYWCDDCNVPLIHKATDRNRGICPLCGKETKYLCADLRPVFPEERLLYEILTAKPFQYKVNHSQVSRHKKAQFFRGSGYLVCSQYKASASLGVSILSVPCGLFVL